MGVNFAGELDKFKDRAVAFLGSSVPWIITAVAILVLLYIVRNVVLPALRRKSAKPERKLLDLEISAAAPARSRAAAKGAECSITAMCRCVWRRWFLPPWGARSSFRR